MKHFQRFIAALCITLWSFGQLGTWIAERHDDTFNSSRQCSDKQSWEYKTEQILLITMATTNVLLLVLTGKITLTGHHKINANKETRHPLRSNGVDITGINIKPKFSCPQLLTTVLGIISFLCVIGDLFYIEWYFKIIKCNQYHILSYFRPSSVTVNENGNFVIWEDKDNLYNWSDAHNVCQAYFGSDLASIHSNEDLAAVFDAISNITADTSYDYNTSKIGAWLGLTRIPVNLTINVNSNYNYGNDRQTDSGWLWQWIDGSSYDYDLGSHATIDLSGDGKNPNCVELIMNQENRSYQFKTSECGWGNAQFVCNYREKYWPMYYFQTKHSKWPLEQIVSQLYYYVFVTLYAYFAVVFPATGHSYSVVVVAISVFSCMFMQWWMMRWNMNTFDEGSCYSFGIMYMGNVGVSVNGLCFLSLKYQHHRIMTGKSKWYRYIRVQTNKKDAVNINNDAVGNTVTHVQTQIMSVNSSDVPPLATIATQQVSIHTSQDSQQQTTYTTLTATVTTDSETGGASSNSTISNACEIESIATIVSTESTIVETQQQKQHQQPTTVNCSVNAKDDHELNGQSRYLPLLSSTQRQHAYGQSRSRHEQTTHKLPSINTSSIHTGDSVLLEQAND